MFGTNNFLKIRLKYLAFLAVCLSKNDFSGVKIEEISKFEEAFNTNVNIYIL